MANPFPVPESIAHLVLTVTDASDPLMKRALVRFTNGYALSIIQGEYTYGSDRGLFEIAPINLSDHLDGTLLDTEHQGDDVLAGCEAKEITYYMKKLAQL